MSQFNRHFLWLDTSAFQCLRGEIIFAFHIMTGSKNLPDPVNFRKLASKWDKILSRVLSIPYNRFFQNLTRVKKRLNGTKKSVPGQAFKRVITYSLLGYYGHTFVNSFLLIHIKLYICIKLK
jgi:hypothetical protein